MHFELKVSLLNLYCQEVARYKKLSQQEECAVIERMCQGDKAARQILIQYHIKICVAYFSSFPFDRYQVTVTVWPPAISSGVISIASKLQHLASTAGISRHSE